MTQANPQIESYFPTPFGFGMNKELADHYLPIIKRILDEHSDNKFFYKGRTTHNQDDFRLAEHPEMGMMKEFVLITIYNIFKVRWGKYPITLK